MTGVSSIFERKSNNDFRSIIEIARFQNFPALSALNVTGVTGARPLRTSVTSGRQVAAPWPPANPAVPLSFVRRSVRPAFLSVSSDAAERP